MNAVRYYLAICILTSHFSYLAQSDIFALPRIFGGAGSFFALSGFLMFPSFEKRPDIKRFYKRRAQRIFPPYFLVVLVAAIGCGLISSMPLYEYFTNAGFWKYLVANLGFMNFLCPDLPGVFEEGTNFAPFVNGALWTMKGEILCYLSVPFVYRWITRSKYSCTRILTFIVIGCGLLYFGCNELSGIIGRNLYVIQKQFCVFMLFYMGALINRKLPVFLKYKWYFLVVDGVLLMADYFSLLDFTSTSGWFYEFAISPFVTGTMVIVCCLTGTWGRALANHDALSYDIYLFHWPVIQVLVYFGLVGRIGAYPTLLLTICVVVALAYLSWRYIGKRFLSATSRPLTLTSTSLEVRE